MTPKRVMELAGHRDVPPWVMKLVMEAVAEEREKQAENEPFDMDDHPPHHLCECRKCMEYFTPLPDCDAFAASGKPIAEQEPIRFIWNGEGWIEADDYIWKTTDDYERRILYAVPLKDRRRMK